MRSTPARVAQAAHFASAVPAHVNVLGFSAQLASSGGEGFRLQTVHSKTLASVRAAMGTTPPPWRSMRQWTFDLLCGLAHLQENRALHLFVGVSDILIADDGRLVVGSIGYARAVPEGATFKISAAEATALISATRANVGRAAPEIHGAIRTGKAAGIARQVEFAVGKMLLDLVFGTQAHPLAKYNGAASWCGATYYERKLLTESKRLAAIDGYPANFADLVRGLLRRDPAERTALVAARDAAERLAIGGDPTTSQTLRSSSIDSAAESAAESLGPAAHDALASNASDVVALQDELAAMRLKYKAAKALYREAQDADALTAAFVAAKKRTEDVELELSEARADARAAFVAAAAAREETLERHAAEKEDLLAELAQTKQELVTRCFAVSGEGSGGGVDPGELELLKSSLVREQRSRTSLMLAMKRLREDASDERQRALAEKALVDQQLIRARNEVASVEGAECRRRIAEEATAQEREAEIDASLKMVASTRADMRTLKQRLDTRTGELAAALARTDDANAVAEEAQKAVERLQMEKRAIQLECVVVAFVTRVRSYRLANRSSSSLSPPPPHTHITHTHTIPLSA